MRRPNQPRAKGTSSESASIHPANLPKTAVPERVRQAPHPARESTTVLCSLTRRRQAASISARCKAADYRMPPPVLLAKVWSGLESNHDRAAHRFADGVCMIRSETGCRSRLSMPGLVALHGPSGPVRRRPYSRSMCVTSRWGCGLDAHHNPLDVCRSTHQLDGCSPYYVSAHVVMLDELHEHCAN